MSIRAPLGRIGEQHEAYRKGLVLGLTMAEVGILIIFVLLLLLAWSELRWEREMLGRQGTTPVKHEELARLRVSDSVLREAAQILGAVEPDSSEDFVKLVRVVQEAIQRPEARSALAETQSVLDDVRRMRAEVARVVDAARAGETPTTAAQEVAREVERQGYRLGNQEGQIQLLQKKLSAAGLGKGERPCWVRPDGTIDFLYDVVLTSGGIRMREHVYPERQAERAQLPMPAVDPGEVLSQREFLDRTGPVFQRSQRDNCRFFVVIYDATATHEKPLYKDLLRTVEGHFYKRLDNGAAPF